MTTSKEEKVGLKNYPMVLVIWEDANGDATEEYEEKDIPGKHEAAVFYSWGWKVLDTDKGLTLFNEYLPKGSTYRSRMFIPRGMIQEIIPLNVSRKRAKSGNPKQRSRTEAPPAPSSGNANDQERDTSGELPAS